MYFHSNAILIQWRFQERSIFFGGIFFAGNELFGGFLFCADRENKMNATIENPQNMHDTRYVKSRIRITHYQI